MITNLAPCWQTDASKIDKALKRSMEKDQRAANFHVTGARDRADISEDENHGEYFSIFQ